MGVLLLPQEAGWEAKPPYGEAEIDPSSWPAMPSRWLFNEPAGLTAFDLGLGNSGTLSGGVVFGATTRGPGATGYNGNNQEIRLNTVIAPSGDFSVSGWFYGTDFTTRNNVLWSLSSSATPFIGILTSATLITIRTGTNTLRNFTVPSMSLKTWYFLVVSRVSNVWHVYLNGVESSTGGISDSGSFSFNSLGGYPQGVTLCWKGNLDNFLSWTSGVALTAQQAMQLYAEPYLDILPSADRIWPMGAAAAATGGPWPFFFDELSGGLQTQGMQL